MALNKILVKFVKPWMGGYKYALNFPDHYKRFLEETLIQPSAVHYEENPNKWEKDPETGEIKRIVNIHIPLIYPKEADQGIWGGEAIIKGFKKKHKYHRRIAHWWIPSLQHTIVYSEILDKYMKMLVTSRTLNLIDEHYGFDSYILETPVQDLKSQLAFDLRRMMLLTLVRKEMYPNDAEKREEIYEKYKKFIIPEEEAEWFGLSIKAAILKQRDIEKGIKKPFPLKHQYRKELFEGLKEMKASPDMPETTDSESWLSKMNFFGKKQESST